MLINCSIDRFSLCRAPWHPTSWQLLEYPLRKIDTRRLEQARRTRRRLPSESHHVACNALPSTVQPLTWKQARTTSWAATGRRMGRANSRAWGRLLLRLAAGSVSPMAAASRVVYKRSCRQDQSPYRSMPE